MVRITCENIALNVYKNNLFKYCSNQKEIFINIDGNKYIFFLAYKKYIHLCINIYLFNMIILSAVLIIYIYINFRRIYTIYKILNLGRQKNFSFNFGKTL